MEDNIYCIPSVYDIVIWLWKGQMSPGIRIIEILSVGHTIINIIITSSPTSDISLTSPDGMISISLRTILIILSIEFKL